MCTIMRGFVIKKRVICLFIHANNEGGEISFSSIFGFSFLSFSFSFVCNYCRCRKLRKLIGYSQEFLFLFFVFSFSERNTLWR